MMTPVEAQARAISSSASAYESVSMPAPPHCSGTAMPSSPSSPRRAKILRGNWCLRSIVGGAGSDLAAGEVARGVLDQLLFG